MTPSPLISVIMPMYNAAGTLEASVRSVIEQEFQDWELLLIDDASRDASLAIARTLASTEPRIRVVALESNLGAAGARNAGVNVSYGRYIAYLDSDDLWLPAKLRRQIEDIQLHPVDISFTDYRWMKADGTPLDVVVSAQDTPTWNDLTWGNNIGLSTALIDRSRLGSPQMPNIRLNHDYAMWLDLLRRGFLARRLPETLVLYRMTPGSLSQNKIESAQHNWRILRQVEGLPLHKVLPRMLVWALRTGSRRARLLPR